MTQAAPATTTAADARPAGRPFGFATPRAAPLSQAEPAPSATAPSGPPPSDFAPPADAVVPLERIAPAPPPPRDPREPYLATLPAEPLSEWRPDQPLVQNLTTEQAPGIEQTPGIDVRKLPPPVASALPSAAGPIPGGYAGPPPGVYPASVPPPNAYPGGPYQQNPYPGAPARQAPYPAYPAPQPGPSPVTQVAQIVSPWVLIALGSGAIWKEIAVLAILVATAIGFASRSAGRAVLATVSGLVMAITALWYAGYIAPSQSQAAAQLLSFVGLLAVLLLGYQRRRQG